MCSPTARRRAPTVWPGSPAAPTTTSSPTARPNTARRFRTSWTCIGQRTHAPEQRVAERRGDARRAVRPAQGPQLLGEERVALGASVDGVELVLGDRAVRDPLELRRRVLACQAAELEPEDGLRADHLGEERAHAVVGRQLVAAEGRRDQDPVVLEVARQVADEVTRRVVGPVDVLDDDGDGLLGGDAPERVQHRRLRVRGPDPAAGPLPGREIARVGGRRPEQRVDEAARTRIQAADRLGAGAGGELAEDADQRREGELATLQGEALAAQRTPSRPRSRDARARA